jgi:predicted Abi (CAAX) family protease
VNKQIFKLWGLVIVALIAIAFLSPVNIGWGWFYGLIQNRFGHLLLDLARIGLLSFIFAGLLAPFEALGWWAGWYGNGQNSNLPLLDLEATTYKAESESEITHYIVYLDGIGKSSFVYSSLVGNFLKKLAASLPSDRVLIRDIMPYSVNNLPLTIGRPLARFWKWIDRTEIKELGVLILLRNMFQVAVSVDSRYGPIYNRGAAQVIIKSLLDRGYRVGSGTPVTLIGYSGGGQVALGAIPYLKKVLAAPLEVISLAGVLSGNTEVVQLEHLYHLVGEKDRVARFIPYLFPQRWAITTWSNWNLAKSRGEISFISLGAVRHDASNGPLDDKAYFPDGSSHLDRTLAIIKEILTRVDGREPFPESIPPPSTHQPRIIGNYERYTQAKFNQIDNYPVKQSIPTNYQPVGNWIGRLVLPTIEERTKIKGVYFEVYYAPETDLIGKRVILSWSDRANLQAYVNQIKNSVHFSQQAYESVQKGLIHPLRLNFWRQVEPLESLAGARPNDDVIVTLATSVTVDRSQPEITLKIDREPIVITGRFYGLVTIIGEITPNSDLFQVRHYNRASQKFDGREETVYIPQVIPDINGVYPSTTHKITESPLNSTGWYIYGELNREAIFTVRAIAPRALFQLQPQQIISGLTAKDYIHNRYWQNIKQKKGKIESILLKSEHLSDKQAIEQFQDGDRLLVLHTYGGIGGKKREVPPVGLFFGHFAFGLARVIKEPISGELQFKLAYGQVYTQNLDGIIAGSLDWTNYIGDRQFGWLGSRPTVDIIVKLDLFEPYNFGGNLRFPLNALAYQLDKMMARYRIGDGTGATFAGFANSCVQDSCQTLYQAIKMLLSEIDRDPKIQHWLHTYPQHPETKRLKRLISLNKALEKQLIPWNIARADWLDPYESSIGTRLAHRPINTIANALTSWRSLLPRLANDLIAEIFLEYGASLWLLKTNQIGGWDEEIEPIAPTKFWL